MRLSPYLLLALALPIGCATPRREAPAGDATPAPAPPPAVAAEPPVPAGPYTEQQLVELAERRHAGLAAARAAVDVAQANRAVVGQPGDPQLRATYRDTTRSTTGGFTEDEQMFDGGLRVFLRHPFQLRAQRKGAALALNAAEAAAEFEAQKVRHAVRLLVRGVAGLRRERALAEQALALTEQAGKIVEQRRASGQATAPEVLAAGFTMLDAAAERDRIEQDLYALLADLHAYLGITVSDPEQILPPAAAPRWSEADLDTDRLLELARAYRLKLSVLRCQKENQKALLDAALARRIPWFQFLEGSYREESGITDSDAWSLSTSLSLPVVTAMGGEADLRRAELSQAQAALVEGEDDVESDVISARDAVLVAAAALQRFEEVMLPLLEQANRGVAESEARADLPLDVKLSLEQSLLKAQQLFLTRQQEYELAVLDLQMAVGVDDLPQTLRTSSDSPADQ